MTRQFSIVTMILGLALVLPGAAMARDQISIVGSSTVFPFSTAVAEEFGRATRFKTPVVEATGSGGGMKLFCAGIGLAHPDITNSSRRIKKSEYDNCVRAGIDMTEIKIGFDGIVIANAKSGPDFSLTLRQVYLATAKTVPEKGCASATCKMVANPYTRWNELDPKLPNLAIEMMGPPPTSGTRDAFVELAMEGGALTYPHLKALKKTDKSKFKRLSHTVREDGVWIDVGENDNLMVSKLVSNPKAVGVFGFSFLDQNADKIKGAPINGVAPDFDNIAAGDYGVSRSLYFYVKQAHIGTVPGIAEFVRAFTDEEATGPDGYLLDKGLIPLQDDELEYFRDAGANMRKLQLK